MTNLTIVTMTGGTTCTLGITKRTGAGARAAPALQVPQGPVVIAAAPATVRPIVLPAAPVTAHQTQVIAAARVKKMMRRNRSI